jgi:hypothetical protein
MLVFDGPLPEAGTVALREGAVAPELLEAGLIAAKGLEAGVAPSSRGLPDGFESGGLEGEDLVADDQALAVEPPRKPGEFGTFRSAAARSPG